MRSRGISLTEVLIAIAVGAIITLALTSLFVGSNRAFLGNRAVSELTEDVRNAITTLEFVFSRWGAGVPCQNNNCSSIGSTLPDCTTYPPTDPQCITIKKEYPCDTVEFYASLYGYGFVLEGNGSSGRAISCRLVDKRDSTLNQSCYLLWNEKGVLQSGNSPKVIRINQISKNNQDCLSNLKDAEVSLTVENASISPGDFLIRAPHKIKIYCGKIDNRTVLFMDREDTADECKESEKSVRIGFVERFEVKKENRTVQINATFVSVSNKDRRYSIFKVFGR